MSDIPPEMPRRLPGVQSLRSELGVTRRELELMTIRAEAAENRLRAVPPTQPPEKREWILRSNGDYMLSTGKGWVWEKVDESLRVVNADYCEQVEAERDELAHIAHFLYDALKMTGRADPNYEHDVLAVEAVKHYRSLLDSPGQEERCPHCHSRRPFFSGTKERCTHSWHDQALPGQDRSEERCSCGPNGSPLVSSRPADHNADCPIRRPGQDRSECSCEVDGGMGTTYVRRNPNCPIHGSGQDSEGEQDA